MPQKTGPAFKLVMHVSCLRKNSDELESTFSVMCVGPNKKKVLHRYFYQVANISFIILLTVWEPSCCSSLLPHPMNDEHDTRSFREGT